MKFTAQNFYTQNFSKNIHKKLGKKIWKLFKLVYLTPTIVILNPITLIETLQKRLFFINTDSEKRIGNQKHFMTRRMKKLKWFGKSRQSRHMSKT